jgi:hypothetical protein
MAEMFDQNYECFGVYFNEELIGVFGLLVHDQALRREVL